MGTVFTEGAVCAPRQKGAQLIQGAIHVAGKQRGRKGPAKGHVGGKESHTEELTVLGKGSNERFF